MRRIAALMDTDDSNSDGQTRVAALSQTPYGQKTETAENTVSYPPPV
jgi:hypothetical protein